ncbi:hypothetical protein OG905_26400 [Streptomyces sp. NBC_00322]|uniref:hypothetical protein n=1 Tax=Streptomyces sp. NBC_00322 TaxID=2975712 RepID=UPI002E2D61A6|nr:hypothetical protein [Streptomyces sp. NBC_00322]
MTYPPNVRTAPQSAPGHAPAQPPARPAIRPPAHRGAWAVGKERLRTAATTEPGRLQIIGAVLAALVVAFGAVTAFEISDRASAADDVVSRSQPLSADAASIHRSLADADAAAANGFLAGAEEPRAIHERYEKDITAASRLLINAATNTDSSTESGRQIAALNEQLPRYTGLIERARANNRQGLPLGGAYLRYANLKMSNELLPAADKLYKAETKRLGEDNDDARDWPFVSFGLGVLALGALVWAQRRNYLLTNRMFNHGLLAATAASTVVILWLIVGHTVARAELNNAMESGQESLKALNSSRVQALQARANENLAVVSRGAVLTPDGKNDQYEFNYTNRMDAVGVTLTSAKDLADDSEGRDPVADATNAVAEWRTRHKKARNTDNGGDYDSALQQIIGPKASTGQSFDTVDAALRRAIDHEQREFTASATSGRGALDGLPVGAAALAVLGAAGAVIGINRRLSEYR